MIVTSSKYFTNLNDAEPTYYVVHNLYKLIVPKNILHDIQKQTKEENKLLI